MPYASASGGSVVTGPVPGNRPDRPDRLDRPGAGSSDENERGDMTGVRVISPLVVIALDSRRPRSAATFLVSAGYRCDRP